MYSQSLPTRERGLKYRKTFKNLSKAKVAPYAGAWIEILRIASLHPQLFVAPYAGAWIEIF